MKNKQPYKKASSPAVQQFADTVSQAMKDGYVALPVTKLFGSKATGPQWDSVLNTYLAPMEENGKACPGYVFSSSATEMPVATNIGTEGLGYMRWGPDDRVPNRVALLSSLLPYTATGNRFNTDVAAGLGPKPKYRYPLVTNGSVSTEEIDYSAAGALIDARILEVQQKQVQFYKEARDAGVTLKREPLSTEPVTRGEWQSYKDMEATLQADLQRLQEEKQVWQTTNAEVEAFLAESNLSGISLGLFEDMVLFDICYPEIRLSQGGKDEQGNKWKPKVTSVGYYEAITCRLERMDNMNRVNYVYVSNRFYDSTVRDAREQFEMMAVPALDPRRPLASLREKVRDARLNAYFGKKKTADGQPVTVKKPTRFILPSFYPAAGRPYYPQPAWWSIFGGSIYQYAANIIADRAKAKENSNMWGKIIYIHTDYLAQLYNQEKADTDEKRDALRDNLFNSINNFLKNRDANGSTLLSFTFTGTDGKEHEAFRIVDVPTATKSEAEAQKTELEEISSIVFFSLGIHPEMLGATPGRSGSSGGTYQREMYLLKQLNMKPTQMIVLNTFNMISRFNEWDSHLVWRIQEHVLSTLDRSKTGITESEVA